MAHAMLQEGKRPEDARVFGIWIGGTAFQFCVAHPVITVSSDGRHEIHANLIFKDEWLFDILSATPHEFADFSVEAPTETIVLGYLNLTPFPFPEIAPQRDIVLPIQQQVTTPLPAARYAGSLSDRSMTILQNYLKIVNDRISTILRSVASNEDKTRHFKPKGPFGTFVESRVGSVPETPGNKKVSQQFAGVEKLGKLSKSLANEFQHKKTSLAELKILLELANFPQLFPELFDYKIERLEDGTNMILYEFEYLDELRDEYGCISDLIDFKDDHQMIIASCLLFAIQTLYGLHTLHEVVGIVHSDISPSNVMFSNLHDTWKLNDFNQSMKVGPSLYLQRIAGTRDYIAPESESTGIFTKSSDIFSLGKVMTDCIAPVILGRIFRMKDLDEEIEPDPQMSKFGRKIFNLIHSLTLLEPSKRPNAIEALLKFFEIYDEFFEFLGIECNGKILRGARMCAEKQKMESNKMEVELPVESKVEREVEEKFRGIEIELKRPKLTMNEREAIFSEILPGAQ